MNMKKILMAAFAALAIFGCNKENNGDQPIADAISVAPKESRVTADGGIVKVIVTSTGEWTLKGKADYSSWVTPSAVKGVDGDVVSFTVKTNPETENKLSEWEFTCGTAKDVFKLTSNGVVIIPEHLTLTSDAKVVLNEKAGEVVVRLETSLGYRTLKHTLTDGAEAWLKYLTTLEVDGGAEMHFAYDALSGLKDRSTEITVTGEGVEPVKVNVLQEAKRVLKVAQPFYTAPVAGGDLVVEIAANVNYEVTIAEEGKSWITPGEKKDGSITFKIAALSGNKRSAKVSFKQTDAKEGATPLSDEITISQLSALIHWAAKMNGNRLFPKWEAGGPGYADSFTLETLVKFDNFDKPAGGIFTIMGIEGKFLLRMGDVGNALNNLQIATSNGNLNVTEFDFEANRWYHIAVTYTGGEISVYVDGDLKLRETRFLWSLNLSPQWSYEPWGDRCFWVGYSYEYNRDTYGQMTEVRIWNKALTEEEINAPDHFYKVDPHSQGLFSYWPFTAGNGDSIEDATGKGNKLYGEKNVRKQGGDNIGDPGIEWVEVALPEK